MTRIIPLDDYILFKREQIKTKSGIILPEKSDFAMEMTKNIVLDVGGKVKKVKPGDEIVMLSKTAMRIDFPERSIGKDQFLIKEENIIAKIVEKKE